MGTREPQRCILLPSSPSMISNTAKPQLQINSPGQGEDVSKGATTSASKSFSLFRWGQLSESVKISFKLLPCTFIAHFLASQPQTASYSTQAGQADPGRLTMPPDLGPCPYQCLQHSCNLSCLCCLHIPVPCITLSSLRSRC